MVKYGNKKTKEPQWILSQYQFHQPEYILNVLWHIIIQYCIDPPVPDWFIFQVTHENAYLNLKANVNAAQCTVISRRHTIIYDGEDREETYSICLRTRAKQLLDDYKFEVQLSMIGSLPMTVTGHKSSFMIQPLGKNADVGKRKIQIYWNENELWWRYPTYTVYNRSWRKIHGFNKEPFPFLQHSRTAITFFLSADFPFDVQFQLTFKSHSELEMNDCHSSRPVF
jgi:hypothetical protein